MINLKYCKDCILPNTRPNLKFDENGICDSASRTIRQNIDWPSRKKLFEDLIKDVKKRNAPYDCVIPVSGGKDSTWQVVTALEYGMRPLCVTWKTPVRNELGEANLQNLIKLGVNHIDFTVNPEVERVFTLKAFQKYATPLIPMHMAMHAIPLQIAVSFKIPLVIWGENSAYEYGGDESLKGSTLTYEWLKKFGVTHGTTAKDWVDDDLAQESLRPYYWPTEQEQKNANVSAIFLGHFFAWDPQFTYKIASEHGFMAAEKPKTGYYAFADIDDDFLVTVHHWMKWYKFGMTRLWDNLSIEVRNGNMSRNEAMKIVAKIGSPIPEYEIEKFCKYIGINLSKFFEIAETFRNLDIWKKSDDGTWYIPDFLIKDWDWKNQNNRT